MRGGPAAAPAARKAHTAIAAQTSMTIARGPAVSGPATLTKGDTSAPSPKCRVPVPPMRRRRWRRRTTWPGQWCVGHHQQCETDGGSGHHGDSDGDEPAYRAGGDHTRGQCAAGRQDRCVDPERQPVHATGEPHHVLIDERRRREMGHHHREGERESAAVSEKSGPAQLAGRSRVVGAAACEPAISGQGSR